MKLTVNDLNNAFVFLERVDLKGKEAQAHTELMMKLKMLHQEITNPVPVEPPDPVKPPALIPKNQE